MSKQKADVREPEGFSGLENIIKKIKEDNEELCRKMTEEAEGDAANRLAYALAQAEKASAEIKKQANAQAEKLLQNAESQGRALIKKELLFAKSELIEQTLKKAQAFLQKLDTEEYFKMLFSFAARSKQEGDGVLYLNQKDLNRMPAGFADSLGSHITVSSTPKNIEDGFILVYGEIEMNCTLNALFHALREELREKAAAVLFETNQ